MDQETALQKIRKCLELGASTNQHEAAVALRQAAKLMEQYRITEDMLSAAVMATENVDGASENGMVWEGILASTIGKAFGIRHFRSGGIRGANGNCVFTYFGQRDRVMLATYAHQVLARAAISSRQAHMDLFRKTFFDDYFALWGPRALDPHANAIIDANFSRIGDEFILGFVVSVHRTVAALIPSESEREQMQKMADELGLKEVEMDMPTVTDSTIAGMQEGMKQKLNVPMGEGIPRPAIGGG